MCCFSIIKMAPCLYNEKIVKRKSKILYCNMCYFVTKIELRKLFVEIKRKSLNFELTCLAIFERNFTKRPFYSAPKLHWPSPYLPHWWDTGQRSEDEYKSLKGISLKLCFGQKVYTWGTLWVNTRLPSEPKSHSRNQDAQPPK